MIRVEINEIKYTKTIENNVLTQINMIYEEQHYGEKPNMVQVDG